MKSVFGLSTAKPIEMAILLALSVIIGITLSWTNAYSAPKPKLPTVSKANWNSRKLVLTVKGRNWGGGQSLVLNDAITGEILGTTQVDLRGKWQMAVSNPAEVPCRVRASAGGQSALRDVKKAPVAYGSATSSLATFAFNDLGMHCYDSDFSVFAILPPFNVLRAQVVRKGSGGTMPEILDSLGAGVSYAAFLDANGAQISCSLCHENPLNGDH
ncbi:MAG: hypothetical protein EHM36_05590 [Deltaproteobacteria bacterium]|nr:MAG: hypothetical protein EHM36_05590 [Deltaproteobacteria bacterium]